MKCIRSGVFLTAICAAGCQNQAPPQTGSITLATTTSTQDSGLLDVLIPLFTKETGIEVRILAVGSGQALELARRGDADVLLTHSPKGEETFMSEGFGESRHPVMWNDFVVVGPADDPAGIRGSASAADAFKRIAAHRAVFISRGDDSGTHQKEKQIWIEAGIEPVREWYVSSGSGMAQTLRIAIEKRAYTLADRATCLAQGADSNLVVLVDGDARLKNPYSVIVVSRKRHPHIQQAAARQFVEFLLKRETQVIIAGFGRDQYGQSLFFTSE